MRASMTIMNVQIPTANITPFGGVGVSGYAGHEFHLFVSVKVTPRTRGPFSGEGIDCPELEWIERIEWFSYDPVVRSWYVAGVNEANMYRRNPTSNTYKAWHSFKYSIAKDPKNNPPPGLNKTQTEVEAKRWIARHGHAWKLAIRDTPGLGPAGGSGGGGGKSLVTGNSRRRVVYFNLGFSGCPVRAKAVQIMETVNGVVTIHKFINKSVPNSLVNDPANLQRWRSQVNTPNNYNFW